MRPAAHHAATKRCSTLGEAALSASGTVQADATSVAAASVFCKRLRGRMALLASELRMGTLEIPRARAVRELAGGPRLIAAAMSLRCCEALSGCCRREHFVDGVGGERSCEEEPLAGVALLALQQS